jgi:hypothetical protein
VEGIDQSSIRFRRVLRNLDRKARVIEPMNGFELCGHRCDLEREWVRASHVPEGGII